MRILIIIWRDIAHPQAGGSEVYFHEMAKRWAEKGNSVDWISGGWKGCRKEESIDGINIIRTGGALSLYLLVPLEYFKLKEKPDIIIDVDNGLPFFSPIFSRRKKVLHVHHVHREVWLKELKGNSLKNQAVAGMGYLLERFFSPLFYRKCRITTLSKSSQEDILKERKPEFHPEIINPGIEFCKIKKFKRNKKPAILFMNRIKKYKGIEILLRAVEILRKKNFNFFEVWVAGRGDDLERMKKYAQKNRLDNVKFFGYVNEEKKRELMSRAWIFVNPSFKEGWGIVDIDANYFGLPVVGSDVGGIRDSVVDGKTGLLFEPGNAEELAKKIKILIEDKKLRENLSREGKKWAKNFSWEKAANKFLEVLKNEIMHHN